MKSAALILAAAAATVTPTSTFPKGAISAQASHEVPALDAVATKLAGHTVSVNCWSPRDWTQMTRHAVTDGEAELAYAAAFTNIARHQIQVGPTSCGALARILARRPVRDLDAAAAVGVLAHESRHAAGVFAENKAECGGIRTLARTAQLLGLSASRALRLQHVYRGMLYPLDPPQYRMPACPAGLPGIVVANQFGPEADVAGLRARIVAVARAIPGWGRLPIPLGALTRCSIVHSRTEEVARIEQLFAPGDQHVQLDVAAVKFATSAKAGDVFARGNASLRCFAAQTRVALRRTDPRSSVHVEPLPAALRPDGSRVDGLRVTFRGAGLALRSRKLVHDFLFVLDRPSRVLLAVTFSSSGGPPPSAIEQSAIRAALR